MLKEHVKQYFGETSLHGLKYITEDGRHPLERVLWVFLFFVGVSLAIFFMHPSKYFSMLIFYHPAFFRYYALYQWSNNNYTRDNWLPYLENWFPWGDYLSKYEGRSWENPFFESFWYFKSYVLISVQILGHKRSWVVRELSQKDHMG